MKSTSTAAQPTLQTVERALSFLEFVAAAKTPQTVQQVSAGLGLNITTCYHLMRTLLARGYLERRADSTLRLGRSVGSLFRTYQLRFNVNEELSTIVTGLADATSETAFLSALEDRTVILKMLVEGSQPLRVTGLYVGLTGNEEQRTSGKAILAHSDAGLRTAILDRNMSGLTSDAREKLLGSLQQEFEDIRARGWAIDEETSPGISSVGAPFFNSEGTVGGAVGIVSLTPRFVEARDEIIRHVILAAHAVTAALAEGQRA